MDAPSDFRDVLRRSPSRLCGELAPPAAQKLLPILLVTSAHNSLSQRADIALTEMGHEVTVQVVARELTPAKRAVTKVRQAKSSAA